MIARPSGPVSPSPILSLLHVGTAAQGPLRGPLPSFGDVCPVPLPTVRSTCSIFCHPRPPVKANLQESRAAPVLLPGEPPEGTQVRG